MTVGTPFEVPKEVFDRAKAQCTLENKESRKWFYMAPEDRPKYFSESILCGYGLYGCEVVEEDGKYMCHYSVGDSCD